MALLASSDVGVRRHALLINLSVLVVRRRVSFQRLSFSLRERYIAQTLSAAIRVGNPDCSPWRLLPFFPYGRGGELLEARITSEQIEHRIEPEQCRGERHVLAQRAFIRHGQKFF